jgi:rhodanese-related sulfurtransferase
MDLTQERWASQLTDDDKAVILDVRTQGEWEEGYIPGAVLIDIYQPQQFLEKIESLDRSKNYYVYCKAGSRSAQACAVMSNYGFANLYNLLGGFMHWQGAVEHI